METNSETEKSERKRRENLFTTNSTNDTGNNTPNPPRKKLKSQNPDIIVSVGSSDNKQEFECYRVILCYFCVYFDTMLSHNLRETETSRIELPDKNPEEWKLFYDFIDPDTSATAKVKPENVFVLAPWFLEYQMDDCLHACDIVSSTDSFSKTFMGVTGILYNRRTFWKTKSGAPDENAKRSIETAEKMFEYLAISEQCFLEKTLERALAEVIYFMKDGYDLLLESNELMEKTINVFQNYRANIQSSPSFKEEAKAFYNGIIDEGNIDWDNETFCSLMRSKLEVIIMKRQMEDKDKVISEMEKVISEKNRKISRLNGRLLTSRYMYSEMDSIDDIFGRR